MDAQKYLSPAALIRRWGGAFTEKTLANWRAQGRGPSYVKAARRVLYPLASVEQWEAANMAAVNLESERAAA